MKRISLTALALVFISISPVGAEELRTTPYTSKWGDFKTVVPKDGKRALTSRKQIIRTFSSRAQSPTTACQFAGISAIALIGN